MMNASGGNDKDGGEGSSGDRAGASDEGGAAADFGRSFAADPLAAVAAGEAFAVVPLEWCPHLEFPGALNPLPEEGIDVGKVVNPPRDVFVTPPSTGFSKILCIFRNCSEHFLLYALTFSYLALR